MPEFLEETPVDVSLVARLKGDFETHTDVPLGFSDVFLYEMDNTTYSDIHLQCQVLDYIGFKPVVYAVLDPDPTVPIQWEVGVLYTKGDEDD